MKLWSFLHFPLFSLGYFLKERENIFFVFLSSYRNTHESLGELEKAVWKHSPAARVPTAFFVLPNLHWCFDRNTENVFYFLNKPIYHQAKCKKLQLIVNNLEWNVAHQFKVLSIFRSGLLLDFFHETDQNVWVMDFWCHRVQKYVDFSLYFYLVPVC